MLHRKFQFRSSQVVEDTDHSRDHGPYVAKRDTIREGEAQNVVNVDNENSCSAFAYWLHLVVERGDQKGLEVR